MKNVLIIYRDTSEPIELTRFFKSQGSNVLLTASVEKALHYFITTDLSLVILDAHLSIEDDHRILKAMRMAKRIPILVLSSKLDCSERLSSLQAGAHAYMGKPYSLEECLAQAQSLMQLHLESHPSEQECFTLVCGKDLVIDPERRQVFLKGKELHLTRTEFDLLLYFASNPGKVFSRTQLYDRVWNEYASFNVDDVVKAHIKALRRKLSETNKDYIKNVWGVGYRFHDEE